jgi:hypothetical protein
METTVENVMLPAVTEILDQVLEGYPDYPHKKAFTNPELRRNLLNRVMNQLPNWHPAHEEGGSISNDTENWHLSEEKKIHIRNIIRQEIAYIIQQKSACISRTPAEEIDSCFTPSHWFG